MAATPPRRPPVRREAAAVGTTANVGSIFGGNGVNSPDTYVFSYTPGTNADNTVYAANAVLGSTTGFPGQGNLATGLVGGVSGRYNVYMTSPPTTNISGGDSTFTVTQRRREYCAERKS